MRIVVDLDLCQGHGVCESEAPGIFELGKGHTVTVLENPSPDTEAVVVIARSTQEAIVVGVPAL